MKHVGIFEAKTHLSSLLDEVEKGGEVTITRHGKPVAKLVRTTEEPSAEVIAQRRAAIASIRARAKALASPCLMRKSSPGSRMAAIDGLDTSLSPHPQNY
jgi:prevent-host-death family protein